MATFTDSELPYAKTAPSDSTKSLNRSMEVLSRVAGQSALI